MMQLFVKTAAKTQVVAVAAETTMEEIKAQLAVEADLYFAGACLEDEMTVAEAQLQENSTVDVVVPLEGGKGKKKKKKIFTKAKKPIHRHKNIKMRVLKFYKVEGDGEDVKVTHERMECPHPKCGAGVFMAAHKNRQTCGKCSLTYVKK
jgi:ubiquitin-small subunit ribosomal protein S27Ae